MFDKNFYSEILDRLDRFIWKENLVKAAEGFLFTLIILSLLFFIFSLLELIFRFSVQVRTILFAVMLLAALSSAVFRIFIPLLKSFNLLGKRDYFFTAGKIGLNFPSVKDDLLNALQLISVKEKQTYYSGSMINAAFKRVYEKTSPLEFESIIRLNKLKRMFNYSAILILIVTGFIIFIPGLSNASWRFMDFNTEYVRPARFHFIIEPGNSTITKGDNVNVRIRVEGEKPSRIELHSRSREQAEFENFILMPDSNGDFNHFFSSVRTSFTYFASAEGIKSDHYSIEVVDRPIVRTLEILLTPPAYSKLSSVRIKDNGNISGLKGTKAEISIQSNKQISKAFLVFSDSTEINFNVEGFSAYAGFTLLKDNEYFIDITDQTGNSNISPVRYTIKVENDAYPSISLINPEDDVTLGNDNRIPVHSSVIDDYGFSSLKLNYRLSYSKFETPQTDFTAIDIPINTGLTEQEIEYIWNLTNLSPGAEDVYEFYLEIYDNDRVSGPKSSRTAVLSVRVPSLEEILQYAEQTQNNSVKELEKTLKEAENLKKELQDISDKLKKDGSKLNWEEKQQVESALEKFEDLQKKTEEISEQLKEVSQKLDENNLLSEETLEKYFELQKLMDELTSDEMKKLMEQLQNALQQLNRNLTQDALQKFQFSEEQFRNSLERTLNLLKRIQTEQKTDEILKRIENLRNQLEKLNEQTKNNQQNGNENSDKLAQKQNQITEELRELGKQMDELSELMSELDKMPVEEMEKIKDEFLQQNNSSLSETAEQNLMQNQLQQAMQNQNTLKQNMQNMHQQFSSLKQSMMQQNQVQTLTDMMKILNNILDLSQQQEELKEKTSQLDPSSSDFENLAREQSNLESDLQSILQQMSSLAQRTFAITPEMGKQLGNAMKQMENSILSLQSRNGNMSALNQSEAMGSLNEAATLLKGNMESMMQGGGKGGMMSLMQQLKQLSGQQMSLNNMTQMLQQLQQGNLTVQQQAELQRLAQQQSMIQKSLRQLNEEAKLSGKSKTLPGNLDRILNEMQEVITDMNTQKLDDELIHKQERILSRMLDAQRSINERDFEKQRESFTGQNVIRESPLSNLSGISDDPDALQQELIKAAREGYSDDYIKLIKKYFESLQKEEQ
ncbi:MAG: hypothetical protein Kow0098_15580 [Ignavibacteriaceae bacterium]